MNNILKIGLLILISLIGISTYKMTNKESLATGNSKETEKYKLTIVTDSVRIISWNIRDFGKTKDEEEIDFMAKTLRDADLVAIQEVVSGYGGAQAVAKLSAALNRKGSQWDYRVSDPTPSPPYKTEKYAILWKTSKMDLANQPQLWTDYKHIIERSPYLAKMRLKKSGEEILLVNYHSRRYDFNPKEELEKLVILDQAFPNDRIIIAGDYNIQYEKEDYNILYQNDFFPSIHNQKTTIKTKKDEKGNHLNYAIDNIFFEDEDFDLANGNALDFTTKFPSLTEARNISDHLPVEALLSIGE